MKLLQRWQSFLQAGTPDARGARKGGASTRRGARLNPCWMGQGERGSGRVAGPARVWEKVWGCGAGEGADPTEGTGLVVPTTRGSSFREVGLKRGGLLGPPDKP